MVLHAPLCQTHPCDQVRYQPELHHRWNWGPNHPQTACLEVLLPLYHWVVAGAWAILSEEGVPLLDVHLAPEVSGRLED